MGGVLVDGDHLQQLVGLVEDGAAGSLIHAPVLHAHQPVLHDVQQADAVVAAQLVQLADDVAGLHLLPVHGHGHALLKVDGHVGGLVGGLEGADAHLQEAGLLILGLVGRVLQIQALVAQVPDVLVLGVVGLPADLQGHVVGLGVVDLLVPALDVPLSPGGDDGHVRGEPLDGQLEPHLVVALAGAAVGDGVGALRLGDLHQLLGDDGPGKGGAQQVLLIGGAHLQRGDDDVVHHLVGQVRDVQLAGAGLDGLLLQALQLVVLAHVAGHGDDLRVVVVLLQPGDDDGRIQAAGIGQHDLLDVLLIHSLVPSALCCLMMFELYAIHVYLFKYHFAQLFQLCLDNFAYLFEFPENIPYIFRNMHGTQHIHSHLHPGARRGIEWTAGSFPAGRTCAFRIESLVL